jgi:hypothetical protein
MALAHQDLPGAMAEVLRLARPLSDHWKVTALDGILRGQIIWQGHAVRCNVKHVVELTFVLLDPQGVHVLTEDNLLLAPSPA